MGNNFKYIVYITINIQNNKYYIGVHKTDTPNKFDGYLGCGAFATKPKTYKHGKTYFHNAICKYGVKNFKRYTLRVFDTLNEALELEKQLVIVDSSITYNMTEGGGNPPSHNKKLFQFSLDGKLIKCWDAIVDATKYFSFHKDKLTLYIKNKKSLSGFYWSHSEQIDISEYSEITTEVLQYNMSGKLLNSFNSPKEAANKLNIKYSSIINSLNDHSSICGFLFLRNNEDIKTVLENRDHYKLRREYYSYDINGKYLKYYPSIKHLQEDFPEIKWGKLSRAIKNKKPINNIYYTYELTENIKSYEPLKPTIHIEQYDLEGNFIKEFDSLSKCLQEFPKAGAVCRGLRKQTRGYVFKYKKVKDIV